jgi:hypothetical protein
VAQVTQTEDGSSTSPPVVSYLHDDVLGSTQSVTNADGTQNTPRNFGLFGTADDALTASDVPYAPGSVLVQRPFPGEIEGNFVRVEQRR